MGGMTGHIGQNNTIGNNSVTAMNTMTMETTATATVAMVMATADNLNNCYPAIKTASKRGGFVLYGFYAALPLMLVLRCLINIACSWCGLKGLGI